MAYWIISPWENATRWDDFRNKGIMGIGFECIGDLNKYPSKESIDNSDFDKNFNELYDEFGTHPNHRKCCWEFANEIKIGDIIFAKDGIHKLRGYGIVESNYIYNENDKDFPHVRKVDWYPFEEKIPTKVYLDRKTLKEVKDVNMIKELCQVCGISE